jgi:GntR family transcriptional regulator
MYAPTRHLVVEELRKLVLEIGRSGLVLPGEPQLASQLGIGRATLRDALTRLEAEGLILRRKGADTIVNTAAFDLAARIDLRADFAEILRDGGFKSAMVVLEDDRVPLTEDAAKALGLEVGTPALRTLKRWDADDKPVMVAVDWVPSSESAVDLDSVRPVFELAAELGGEEIAWEVAVPGRWPSATKLQRRSSLSPAARRGRSSASESDAPDVGHSSPSSITSRRSSSTVSFVRYPGRKAGQWASA